ncbi:hypothetical protein BYI23_D015590 (plasmid) [Burkholderia sp. YI23]|nr:hypothetical protein BYI23_D015590 [Burkholderia sp. YI23]
MGGALAKLAGVACRTCCENATNVLIVGIRSVPYQAPDSACSLLALSSDVASGNYERQHLLNMLRASPALDYPKDDRPVSFEGHDFVPPVFGAIDDAWRRVN